MNTRALLCAIAVLPLSTGCAAAAEKVAEKAAEEMLEEAIDGEGEIDIDFDDDGGNITITGEDGEKVEINADEEGGTIEITGGEEDIDATINADGSSYTIEDGEGNVTVGGAELAEGWPSEYPLPSDVEIITSLRSVSDGDVSYMVQFQGSGSFEDVADHVKGYGGTPMMEQSATSDGTQTLLIGWEYGDNETVNVFLTEESDGTVNGTVVLVNIAD